MIFIRSEKTSTIAKKQTNSSITVLLCNKVIQLIFNFQEELSYYTRIHKKTNIQIKNVHQKRFILLGTIFNDQISETKKRHGETNA